MGSSVSSGNSSMMSSSMAGPLASTANYSSSTIPGLTTQQQTVYNIIQVLIIIT